MSTTKAELFSILAKYVDGHKYHVSNDPYWMNYHLMNPKLIEYLESELKKRNEKE
jgi:hypothetical protein